MSDNPPTINSERQPLGVFEDYAAKESADMFGVSGQNWINMNRDEKSLVVLYAMSSKYKNVLASDNTDQIMFLARDRGYEVRKVGMHESEFLFKGVSGDDQSLTSENSVQIGEGKKLYVGVKKDGQIFDIIDLRHDVGAILLGGKVIPRQRTVSFEKDWFTDMVPEPYKSSWKAIIPRLEEFGDTDKREGKEYVYDTYMLDAIVSGEIDSRIFKYATLDLLARKQAPKR